MSETMNEQLNDDNLLIDSLTSELSRVYGRFVSLLSLHREIKINNTEPLIKQVTRFIYKVLPVDFIMTCFYDETGNEFVNELQICGKPTCPRQCPIKKALSVKKGFVIDDLPSNPDYVVLHEEYPYLKSILVMPLLINGQWAGAFLLGRAGGTVFVAEDLRIMQVIGDYINMLLENKQYYHKLIEQERFAQELKLAGEIQRRLSPAAPLYINDYEVFGISSPCHEIGGDYFDYFVRRPEQAIIAVGDIMGKGLDASLFAIDIRRSVLDHANLFNTPEDIMLQVAGSLSADLHRSQRFISAIVGVLDCVDNTFSYANAGHLAPLHYHAGADDITSALPEETVIGVRYQKAFTRVALPLSPGDIVLLYTDGILEVENELHMQYGPDRIRGFLKSVAQNDSREIVEELIKDVSIYMGKESKFDDATIVAIKRKEAV